jgi:hypothetical protein
MRKSFIITEEDKNRILGMHENATKRQYLMEASTTGCIQGDCENGQGTYTWSDGSKYVGQWKVGKENGNGTYTGIKGYVWTGEFKDGKPVGATFNDLDNTIQKNVTQQYTTPDVIQKIQNLLIDKKYSVGKFGADGKFGNNTAMAVLKALQNLPVNPSQDSPTPPNTTA